MFFQEGRHQPNPSFLHTSNTHNFSVMVLQNAKTKACTVQESTIWRKRIARKYHNIKSFVRNRIAKLGGEKKSMTSSFYFIIVYYYDVTTKQLLQELASDQLAISCNHGDVWQAKIRCQNEATLFNYYYKTRQWNEW